MTKLDRRTFLGLLSAAAAAPVAPAIGATSNSSLLIENQTFALSRPLDLRGYSDVTLRNCLITAAEEFEGDYLLGFDHSEMVEVSGCRFDCRNMPMSGAAMRLAQP